MAIYTDDFNRTNGAISVGNAAWVARSGYTIPSISANVCVVQTAVGAYYNQTFNNDQYCQVSTNGLSIAFQSRHVYMFVRGNTTDQACYAIDIVSTDNGETGWDLNLTINLIAANGAPTPLNSYSEVDAGATGLWKLEAIGSVISVYRDSILKLQVTDGTIAGGKPGFYGAAGNTGVTVDNFEAGDIGGGGNNTNLILNTLPITAPGMVLFISR